MDGMPGTSDPTSLAVAGGKDSVLYLQEYELSRWSESNAVPVVNSLDDILHSRVSEGLGSDYKA